MKTKYIYFVGFLFLTLSNFVIGQINFTYPPPDINNHGGELSICNQTKYWRSAPHYGPPAYKIVVKIIPVGALFTGDFRYSPKGMTTIGPPYSTNNITGGIFEIDTITSIPRRSDISINLDDDHQLTEPDLQLNIGLSLYKIEFWNSDTTQLINTLYIDWRDSYFKTPINDTTWGQNSLDIRIDYFSTDTITFQHYPHNGIHYFYHIDDVDKYIRMWEFYGTNLPHYPYSKGNFAIDTSNNGSYLKWPINANKYNGNIGHENPGDLGMNIEINDSVTTRDTLSGGTMDILIPKKGYLKINPGKTFDMITAVNGYNNLIIQDSSELRVLGKLIVGSGNSLTLRNKGTLTIGNEVTFDTGSYFCNEGGKIGGRGSINFLKGSHPSYCVLGNEYAFSDSVKMILEDSATLEIPDSVTMHFTGKESALIMNPHSKLKLGVGSKIVFDSSATLKANGATFTSLDSNYLWEGIVFNNSGYDTVKNCTFKNAKTSISIINSGNFSYIRRILRDNIFNVPSGGDFKGIYGENNYRITIAGNIFNMPVVSSGSYIYTGIYLKNSSTSGMAMEDEEPVPQYMMNIVNNVFNNGSTSIILANYISTLSTYYVGKNTFNNASDINLIGMKINGRITNNNFTSDDVPMGVHLINSSPDMFGNSIAARDISIHLAGHCYPNLAPYISDDYLVWTGGKNTLSTVELDNVQLSSTGNIFTDWGRNSFNTENSSAEHIYGFVDSSFANYKSRRNCFSPEGFAKITLKKYFDSILVATLNSNEDCEEAITPVSVQGDYLGSEMYDTVLISEDNTGEYPSEAEVLFTQGRIYMDINNNDAITTFKHLVDNYPNYEHLESAAGYLYECYQTLDTTSDTTYRNTLYGNLKLYLEDKIESGYYYGSHDFIDVSYDIILACETITENYDDALNGYEFISLFHPDPNIRLIASWDYEEVETLINSGYGGGERQFQISNDKLQNQFQVTSYELQVEELREMRELQRLEEVINDDPVLRKMKANFEKKSEERKDKIEKEISKESKLSETVKEYTRKSAQLDNIKEDRAKRNILESALLNPKEKEKRRMEDMLLTTKNVRNQIDKNENVNVFLQYKLEQNYPNPFNPETKINFTIPNDGKVTLKIYDILGKEVKTLVNEFRNSGSYQVTFSGINLSSGVYYYKIEAGRFTQVRKMVLLK